MNKKNLIVLLTVFLMAVFISACGGSSDQNDNADNNNKDKVADEENNSDNESNKNSDDNDADKNSEEAYDKNDYSNNDDEALGENSNQAENTSEDSSDDEGSDALAEYSPKEIEYARIWLQLGDTQNIDELNVQHISSGEPLNPDDETSIDYPEDVVQLTGSRLVEGSITYSSNGDGTIKLYNKVPQRWDGKNPAGEDAYKQIIEDTKQESIDTGDGKKVVELIKKLNIHS
ncbi:hypothetical protein [Lentibacillus salinarum]|uniref:Lipoprotein n=1 Tax=Lentibacillus salinarum TaxID=446820 RepID=A0ABW3ZSB5_9BACI